MADPTGSTSEEEFVARLRNMNAETEKFIAEQRKLGAEAMKLEREHMTILITAVATVSAVIGAAVTWVAAHLPPAH